MKKFINIGVFVENIITKPNGKRAKNIGCMYDTPKSENVCKQCGACVDNKCDNIYKKQVLDALKNKKLKTVVAMAPSVRVSLGEMFGFPVGANVKTKAISALKKLGFDEVFDIDFGADLTVIEEGREFIERLKTNNLPMFTSCCPGWVNFVEKNYSEYVGNLSSCKSPQGMFGSIMKTYFAKKTGIDAKDIFVVTIMPCLVKKVERLRKPFATQYHDVDVVLTVKECGEMLIDAGIDLKLMEDGEFDNQFGLSSGAGVLFGTAGGVMEASIRSMSSNIRKKTAKVDYLLVRGLNGVKASEMYIDGKKVSVAVVSGLTNARELLEKIKAGKVYYDFIEVMACPGGCVNGSGMPIHSQDEKNNIDYVGLRAKGLRIADTKSKIFRANENPAIIDLYKDFLISPNSKLSHNILHTSFNSGKK